MPEEGIVPQATLAVTAMSRPKRVAFFVHPEKTNDDELIQVVRYSVGVWGGRFHAIIPTTGAEITPDWWKLLVMLDPDVIYSLLPVDDVLIRRINRHVLPAKIIEVTPEDTAQTGRRHLIQTFDIGALDIEPIPRFVWATRGFMHEPFFFYIKDSWQDAPHRAFVVRNFGVLPPVISMNTAFRDLPHEVVESHAVSPAGILERLLRYRERTVIPMDLCRMYAQRSYSLEYEPFARGFHLVVGDNPLDAIYAWNRALTSESGSSRDVFWLSEELSRDEDVVRLVGEWIRQTFWSDAHGRWAKVVSYSVDEGELRRVAESMSGLVHLSFEPVRLAPDRFPCPDSRSPGPISERHTDLVPLSESRGLVGFPRPPFLVEGHPQFGWMVEVSIQYHPERYRYTNVRPNWELPKRVGLAGKFFDPYRESRVVNGGLPSAAVVTVDRAIGIRVPSDLDVVWTYLERDHTNTGGRHPQPRPRFSGLHVSDKGRYLQGLLGLFGSVHAAGSTFDDPFWRDVFLRMAGRPDDEFQRRTERALEGFKAIFAEDPTPITADSDRLKLVAEALARRLTLRDAGARVMTRENLATRIGQLRAEALSADPHSSYWKANQKFDEFKEQELQGLLEEGVLLQGAELACPHCGTRQWYVVDDLTSEMRCNGCLFHFPLPPTPEWSFRLNDLVCNALRKHGTLAVLQALYQLERLSGGMFLFLPCQDIFEGHQRNPFTDLDLVVICNGKFLIGEVKSDPGGFEPSDFVKLREVAEELLPDAVILAAPGEKWPEEVEGEIRRLEEALGPAEVKASARLLRWR